MDREGCKMRASISIPSRSGNQIRERAFVMFAVEAEFFSFAKNCLSRQAVSYHDQLTFFFFQQYVLECSVLTTCV